MTHLWIILLFVWMVETCLNLRPPVGAWKFDFLLLGGRSNNPTDPLINGCSSILGQACGALPRLCLGASFSLTDEASLDVSASQIGTFTSLKSKINILILKKKISFTGAWNFWIQGYSQRMKFQGRLYVINTVCYFIFRVFCHCTFFSSLPIIKPVINRCATRHLARGGAKGK